MRITEVTEIQFVNDELVDVAAQCLVDFARESESGFASAAAAAPSRSEKELTESGQASPEPEKEPEGTDEVSDVQAGKDDSHKQAGEQCATAQNSSKPTSSAAVLTQDATASLEKSTSEHDDESDEESGQDWV